MFGSPRNLPRSLSFALLAASALALAGCGSAATGAAGSGGAVGAAGAPAQAVPAGTLPGEHVHGVARNPGDHKVYLATHQGLFRYDNGTPVRLGPVVDYMGFAVAGPGRFYSSGHPAEGVDLPAPVGLMGSTDAGNTWTVQSLGGQSDFHVLTASTKGVMGYDGALKSSTDAKTWNQLSIAAEPTSLAAAPNGSKILATTAAGVLASTDQGATWAPLPAAGQLVMVAWADNTTATGVTPTGHLATTTNAGATWTTAKGRVDSAQALSASRTNGTLEILLVTNTTIQRTTDSGTTFTPLGNS